ncbi:flavoprotein [Toxoplasma gondii ME49]|uniref:Flavoprotein n=4 Tax=Toxoplasma gondii TaxID=5811 RepID=A0A0F7USU6_TOXGV|nr:flavoprotein [Toxoplasma gondii ME49]EPT30434.1 flavoprotein [Toxoplasma gondii ME49]ESS31568.1 flavoprotein [Toxoplasma gondii VEG]CEL73104.1 TPA: flavoprotein domain-containing protein [Toxoplasma gondii VEG]|eukprot:XP_018637499.1 flavoprotein [Toxoplasma gondii ME49]
MAFSSSSDSSSSSSPSSFASSSPLQVDRRVFEEGRRSGDACSLCAVSQETGGAEANRSCQSGRLKVLLAVTGSVAAIKVPEIAEELHAEGRRRDIFVDLRVVATKDACHFLESCSSNVLRDEDDWKSWKRKGDSVLHIELRRWADVFAIAPLSANSLAKISQGLCDNLVTCVARAWDFEKPFVVFPAMNSLMWKHPVSAHQLSILRSFGVKVVDPVEKTLACGDTGVGALPPPRSVAAEIFRVVSPAPGPLSEKEREENGRLRGDTETDCSQSDASACSMQTQRF